MEVVVIVVKKNYLRPYINDALSMAKLNSENQPMGKRSFLKQWLEKLQQESWQLELLISGLALFGIYEAKPWIDEIGLYLSTVDYKHTSALSTAFRVLIQSGWLIFFLNLLVHVILRGLWIGAIGLRYVSRDIDYDTLGYNDLFTKYLQEKVGEYDDFIERLERICSVLFAYTFLLFLLLMSLVLFFTQIFLIAALGVVLGSAGSPNFFCILLLFVYMFGAVIVFADLISLGGFKKISDPKLAKVYQYIYLFYSYATLSFLYRPLLYNFIDNSYTRKLFFLSIPYIFIILFYRNIISNEPFPYWSSTDAREYGMYVSKMTYEDERKAWYEENSMRQEFSKEELPYVTLSQWQVDRPYLEIFLLMQGNDQYLLSEQAGLIPFKKPGFRISFTSDRYEDELQEELVKNRLDLTKELRAERRKLRKLIRKEEEVVTNTKRLAVLDQSIDSITQVWLDKLDRYKEQKVTAVVDTMLAYNKLFIDDVPIQQDLNCYLYSHPNFQEKGLLCMYPTDSLSLGEHILSLDRQRFDSDGKSREVNLDIPFYKVRTVK